MGTRYKFFCYTLLLIAATTAVTPAEARPVKAKKFVTAVEKNKYKRVSKLLQRDISDEVKQLGLKSALMTQNAELVEMIAAAVVPDNEAMTMALRSGKPQLLESLDRGGGRFTDHHLLFESLRQGDGVAIEAILKSSDSLTGYGTASGDTEMTALGLAVVAQQSPAVQAALTTLLQRGADATRRIKVSGHLGTSEQETSSDQNQSQDFVSTPLIEAVRRKNAIAVEEFLAQPIAVDATDSAGRNACSWAREAHEGIKLTAVLLRLCPELAFLENVRKGDVAAIRQYIENKNSLDVYSLNYDHAIHIASGEGHLQIVDLLLAAGVSPNHPSAYEKASYPLSSAIVGDHFDVMERLVSAGAEIDVLDGWGTPMLHYAATDDSIPAMQKLLELGADIHIRDEKGITASVKANQIAELKIVAFLRSQGLFYGPEFTDEVAMKNRRYNRGDSDQTSYQGVVKEGVLIGVEKGSLRIRGQWVADQVGDLVCKPGEQAQDAAYFYAPALAAKKKLPQPEYLKTLKDADFELYRGAVIRVGAVGGECKYLALPTAERDNQITLAQVNRMPGHEVRGSGNVLDVITSGQIQMSSVVTGKLASIREQVVMVTFDNGTHARCKLTYKTNGIEYDGDKRVSALAEQLERALMGGPPLFNESAIGDSVIAQHVGKKVKVSVGNPHCTYFELM